MSERRVVCPCCGQEWLRIVRLVAPGEEAIWCRECDATWLKGVEVSVATCQDYGTLMRRLGRMQPEQAGEIEILGFAEG